MLIYQVIDFGIREFSNVEVRVPSFVKEGYEFPSFFSFPKGWFVSSPSGVWSKLYVRMWPLMRLIGFHFITARSESLSCGSMRCLRSISFSTSVWFSLLLMRRSTSSTSALVSGMKRMSPPSFDTVAVTGFNLPLSSRSYSRLCLESIAIFTTHW